MNNVPISRLGIGPMSSEIIEATFRFSQKHKLPLMLISSKNQIDWGGGYVNGWKTKQYHGYIDTLKKKYAKSKVYICRDHCGPGFNGKGIADVYKTIDDDIQNKFDLIHVDFCHVSNDKAEVRKHTIKAIKYIRNKAENMLIEVGTDENTGAQLHDVRSIEEDMSYFLDYNLTFYVCQTGSLIKEMNQVGTYNAPFIKKISQIAKKHSIFLKEHNADYMPASSIKKRKGVIGALNVAPQFGVLQTLLTLQKCTTYGIDVSDFLNTSYKSKKWQKWLYKNTASNTLLCATIAGHYNFHTTEYKRIYEKISKHENFTETVITEMMKNFQLYTDNL